MAGLCGALRRMKCEEKSHSYLSFALRIQTRAHRYAQDVAWIRCHSHARAALIKTLNGY
jgi:hypothetical protein